jgi:hypothetical protein
MPHDGAETDHALYKHDSVSSRIIRPNCVSTWDSVRSTYDIPTDALEITSKPRASLRQYPPRLVLRGEFGQRLGFSRQFRPQNVTACGEDHPNEYRGNNHFRASKTCQRNRTIH